jgi:ABC-type phosphate/phosphonate transport system substrate-binding protein
MCGIPLATLYPNVEPLAAPVTACSNDDRPTYRSVWLVRADSAFDTLSGLRCRLVVVLVGESVEHHCSGQYHRSRVGLALAHDIGAVP